MHKLSRREALRGTGVAALAVGAAVVPFAAKASTGEEEAMRLWQEFMAAEVAFVQVLRSDFTEQEEAEASDFAGEARLRITRLSVTGPLAIAVKLATIAIDDGRDYMMQRAVDARDYDLDKCCLVSIYQHSVSQCGYDPLADYWNRYDNLGLRS